MRTRIKICGITRSEDAALAIAAGADALGFVLWPGSPRAMTTEQVAAIDTTGPLVARVGVFVNAAPAQVSAAVRAARLSAVQLHGDEDVSGYARLGTPVIKAIALSSERDVAQALALPPEVTVLIDHSDTERRGGTGSVANWELARQVSKSRPVILAGGLSSANVATALREVQPWGIDVSSGVESAPGIKSAERMRELFAAVSAAQREEQ